MRALQRRVKTCHDRECICARTGSLSRDTLENVVDEGVQDGHRLVRDTRVGVDLLEDYTRAQLPVSLHVL